MNKSVPFNLEGEEMKTSALTLSRIRTLSLSLSLSLSLNARLWEAGLTVLRFGEGR